MILALGWNPAVGIPMLVVGLIVLALIWLFGEPDKEQGRRRPGSPAGNGERREPVLGEGAEPGFENTPRLLVDDAEPGSRASLEAGLREELERLGSTLAGQPEAAPAAKAKPRVAPRLAESVAAIINTLRTPSEDATPAPTTGETAPAPAAPAAQPEDAADTREPPRSELGRRPQQVPVERIVTLFVVARDGTRFHGPDLVVAAEKAGLEYGDMGIFHRLVDGRPHEGPVFSMANMLKPGSFDLANLPALETPGLSLFMTLPAPLPALDAWDAMLPAAQRLAELLDGHVLDEERNALGRQGIAHIRDQLRHWDRDHEGEEITFGW